MLQKRRDQLAQLEELLKKRMEARRLAIERRDQHFSNDSMKYMANTAAVGLKFADLNELRALKVEPPPIVQLVMRCVLSLIHI